MVFIFELLRRHKISEALTLWWMFIGLIIIILTLCKRLLLYVTVFLGTALPMTTLILFSLLFILFMLVYLSMKISVLSNQVKEISQYISILQNEFDLTNNKENKDK
jgi:hypothetical protein